MNIFINFLSALIRVIKALIMLGCLLPFIKWNIFCLISIFKRSPIIDIITIGIIRSIIVHLIISRAKFYNIIRIWKMLNT